MRRVVASTLLAALAGIAACGAALPNATEQDGAWAAQRWPGTTVAELNQGRSLYVEHCSGCHALKSADAIPPGQWRKEIREMRSRRGVKTSDEDAELMARFLETVGTRLRAAEPAER